MCKLFRSLFAPSQSLVASCVVDLNQLLYYKWANIICLAHRNCKWLQPIFTITNQAPSLRRILKSVKQQICHLSLYEGSFGLAHTYVWAFGLDCWPNICVKPIVILNILPFDTSPDEEVVKSYHISPEEITLWDTMSRYILYHLPTYCLLSHNHLKGIIDLSNGLTKLKRSCSRYWGKSQIMIHLQWNYLEGQVSGK